MIRFIATDIDGTLVREGDTHLNPRYFELIRELTDRGIGFAVATGRHGSSVYTTFAPVLDRIWIISQNGACIEHGGQTRVKEPIPDAWVREFWQDLSQREPAESIVETADATYCAKMGSSMYRFATEEYGFPLQVTGGWDRIPKGPVSMMNIYHPDSAETFMHATGIYEKWHQRLEMVATGKTWVDCMMPGISKGSAMTDICRELGIDPRDTIAFGDNQNDIPLIQAAGIGYAVENARTEVREAADRIIPGYKEDGVLQVLEALLKSTL